MYEKFQPFVLRLLSFAMGLLLIELLWSGLAFLEQLILHGLIHWVFFTLSVIFLLLIISQRSRFGQFKKFILRLKLCFLPLIFIVSLAIDLVWFHSNLLLWRLQNNVDAGYSWFEAGISWLFTVYVLCYLPLVVKE